MFEVKYRDGLARVGYLETRKGKITTPALLPVINPAQILISPKELKDNFKCNSIITNAYIIYKNEILKKECLEKGLPSMLDFDAPIMTDSGSFQAYEYGDVKINNEEILEFQTKIESDIITMFDIISPLDRKYSEAKKDVDETIKRAKQTVEKKGDRLLACTVQGGVYYDLREYCAEEISKLDCDIFALGGVVPLLESYNFEELVEVVLASKKVLSPSKPVHLFGCGHPMIFSLAVLLGCDIFDSASYAKYARSERLVFPEGTKELKELAYSPCICKVCDKFEELKELSKEERIKKIAEHNLYVSFSELEKVKQAIYENNLWELVEQRSTVHPALGRVLKVIAKYKEFLEKFDNLSRKSFFYISKGSLERPAIYRYEKRLFERYEKPDAKILIILPEGRKPYERTYSEIIREVLKITDAHFVVNSCLGPVPIELNEIYPLAHFVAPQNIYQDLVESVEKLLNKYLDTFEYSIALFWDGEKTLETLKFISKKNKGFDLDLAKLKAVANLQFGKNASKALFDCRNVKIIKSKTTKRIRNVLVDGEHALSMRNDGFFTLKLKGAKLLHSFFPIPKLRVVVSGEAKEFVKQGRNVFAKFVKFCDENLVPYDEALIVDENDNLLGAGRAVLNSQEMLSFKRGVAVKIRE